MRCHGRRCAVHRAGWRRHPRGPDRPGRGARRQCDRRRPGVTARFRGLIRPFRRFLLNPGDRVDTRSGGRVVIDLSDGSMVVVEPQSVVVLKDFRQAESLRELFEITLGKVRVKINHFGGRPNPYRMNSPTASIAVRGTEFSIEVSPTGDTQVIVYEGAVQVTSLSDPSQSVLVEAGRGVLVQAGRDFHMLARRRQSRSPGGRTRRPASDRKPARYTAHHAVHDRSRTPTSMAPPCAPPPAPTTATWPASPISPRCLFFIASMPSRKLIWTAWRIRPMPPSSKRRKAASSCCPPSAADRMERKQPNLGPAGAQSSDYGLSPQVSIFSPIGHSGFVAGGSLSFTRRRQQLSDLHAG